MFSSMASARAMPGLSREACEGAGRPPSFFQGLRSLIFWWNPLAHMTGTDKNPACTVAA